MAAVSVFTACEVCGEVENRIHMKQIGEETYVHYDCLDDMEPPRGRLEDGTPVI